MTLRLLFILSLSLFVFVRNVSAQILDDSTKNIYGPTTTRYILEEDLYNIKGRPHGLDTSITNAHLYDYLYGSNPYQNLGLIGTPLNPIYYTPPQTIGRNLGITIFDAYAYDPSGINYYDTKSPYSKLRYVQGSRGQQILEADFARNVNPRWNLGVDFRRVASLKQIGSTIARDPQASGYAAAVYTRYFTKNQRYQLLFNYTHLHQSNNEFGGVRNKDTVKIQELTNFRGLDGQLNSGVTRERRNNFHLYHQYGILKDSVLQIFHIADYQYRDNRYQDLSMAGDTFYLALNVEPIDSLSMTDRTDFDLLENKIGLKGQIRRLNYKAYFRAKQFTYSQVTDDTITSNRKYKENFLGGELAYVFKDTSVLSVSGQYYIGGEDYFLKAHYTGKFLSGGFYRINYSPTLVQSNYIGNFFRWNNSFSNTLTDNLWLDLNLKLGRILTINPGIRYTGIKDYIYFSENFVPAQENENIKLYMASMNFFLRIGKFNITERLIYTKYDGTKPPVLNIPEIYSHTRTYFQSRAFHKAAVLQLGLDAFWRSTYNANGYMPIIEQFYLNNSVPVKNYMLVDLFLDVRVKRANVFVKISNLLQGAGSPSSPFRNTYYTTPGYPGLPRSFDFGIMWMFFD